MGLICDLADDLDAVIVEQAQGVLGSFMPYDIPDVGINSEWDCVAFQVQVWVDEIEYWLPVMILARDRGPVFWGMLPLQSAIIAGEFYGGKADAKSVSEVEGEIYDSAGCSRHPVRAAGRGIRSGPCSP